MASSFNTPKEVFVIVQDALGIRVENTTQGLDGRQALSCNTWTGYQYKILEAHVQVYTKRTNSCM